MNKSDSTIDVFSVEFDEPTLSIVTNFKNRRREMEAGDALMEVRGKNMRIAGKRSDSRDNGDNKGDEFGEKMLFLNIDLANGSAQRFERGKEAGWVNERKLYTLGSPLIHDVLLNMFHMFHQTLG